MKYYLLNKEEVRQNIWVNPMLIRTKCLGKIKKIRTLQKKLDVLMKAVMTDLKNNNAAVTDEKVKLLLDGTTCEEISRNDYNKMYAVPLYDTQEQRISSYVKTKVLKGKLYGNEIILDKD